MVRFAFALVGAVQPAPSHTISEYVHVKGFGELPASQATWQPVPLYGSDSVGAQVIDEVGLTFNVNVAPAA